MSFYTHQKRVTSNYLKELVQLLKIHGREQEFRSLLDPITLKVLDKKIEEDAINKDLGAEFLPDHKDLRSAEMRVNAMMKNAASMAEKLLDNEADFSRKEPASEVDPFADRGEEIQDSEHPEGIEDLLSARVYSVQDHFEPEDGDKIYYLDDAIYCRYRVLEVVKVRERVFFYDPMKIFGIQNDLVRGKMFRKEEKMLEAVRMERLGQLQYLARELTA